MSRPGQPGRMVQRGQRDRLGGNSYRCWRRERAF